MKRFTVTKNRMIGMICGALLPVMAMGLGILMLTKDIVLSLGVAVTYFILPLIAVGLLGLCIFLNCKTWKKFVLSGIILVIFCYLFLNFAFWAGWTQVKGYEGGEAAHQYSSARNQNTLMPDLSEIGETANIEHYTVSSTFVIFSSETDYLICQYAQEEYELQKAQLDCVYTFQTETIADRYSNCEPSTEIDGYQFRMLSTENYENYFYPKKILLIGCSDAAREIVYLEFYDGDLDYIPSLKEFIMDECGWKYIR